MATLTGGVIASTNTDFDLLQNSLDVTQDIFQQPVLKTLQQFGCLNFDAKGAIGKGKGAEASLPNIPRADAGGDDVALSTYSQALTVVGGTRKIRVEMLRQSFRVVKGSSIYAQRDSHGILDPKWVKENISIWFQNMFALAPLYQGAGSVGTSISAPLVRSTAFSGSILNNVKGMAAGIAPSTIYTAYGSGASLGNDSLITATNAYLTYQDLQAASRKISRAYAGVPKWNLLGKNGLKAIGFISDTGREQLLNQARAAGADSTMSEMRYRHIEAGNGSINNLNTFDVPELGFKFFVVPDDMMPRADGTGTENELSRTCVLFGRGAIDMAFGNAYAGTDVPSVMLKIDDKTYANDDWDYITGQAIFAIKKAQLPGFGANIANTYDNATYVIKHSAAS